MKPCLLVQISYITILLILSTEYKVSLIDNMDILLCASLRGTVYCIVVVLLIEVGFY
ncbi:hypothetical protein Hanom_Chr17g01570211 [Helianthus anomalus]